MNGKIIVNILGRLLAVISLFQFFSLFVSRFYGEEVWKAFFWSGIITLAVGVIAFFSTRNFDRKIGKREGYIIVSLVWIVASIFGCLPYLFSNAIPSITNAFFETMSGFTTTGSSILNNIEELPYGILFWRSITQWMGGMGIIVLFLAVLPRLGIGGRELFVAEVPGPSPDKLAPRIVHTARRLWFLYVVLTLVEALLLTLGGMNFFDAICHAFTTMATGGYSTKQASIGHFTSPLIQYIIIFFMFMAGINFALTYAAFTGKFDKLRKDEEFKFYLIFIAVFLMLILSGLLMTENNGFEQSFREALFTVVSIITTTGYVTADYLQWIPFIGFLIIMLMFFGGSAGSTGGGMKIVRIVLLLKNSYYELRRLIHPSAVVPVRYNKHAVNQQIVFNVMAFAVFYIMIFSVSSAIMSLWTPDIDTAMSSAATSIGNIGPGFGAIGPMENFSSLPNVAKWFLSFLMLLGRLEFFTVLVLFSPSFWKR